VELWDECGFDARTVTDDAADLAGVLEGEYPIPVTVAWIVLHLLHDLEHHVLDIRRGYAKLAMADHPEVHTVQR